MIGEIYSTKDKYEILYHLLYKLKPRFEKISSSVLENKDSKKMNLKVKNDIREINNANLRYENCKLEILMEVSNHSVQKRRIR